MIGGLLAVLVKVALWTGAVMAVDSAGYTAYDVASGALEAMEGARRSSRAAREAAEEFTRPGSGEALDELQQDHLEGQLAQHRGIGKVSSTITQNLLTSVGPFSGDSTETFSTDTLTTLAQIPETITAVTSGGDAGDEDTDDAGSSSGEPGDGTYRGKLAGFERWIREGDVTVNEIEIKVFDDILTFSGRFVIEHEGVSYDGDRNSTLLCSVSSESVVETTPMSLAAGGAFADTVRWNYTYSDWTGSDCDDESRDQDQFEDIDVRGHVLDGGRIEGELIDPASGEAYLTFTAED